MEKGAILCFSLAIALAPACGAGDAPESMRGRGGPVPGQPPGEVGTFSEKVVESDPAPLPIAGGTLAILAQGTKAAIADRHDRWW